MQHELSGECLRKFEKIEQDGEALEKRVRDLEKFQVAIISIVGVANFIWVFFIHPFIVKITQ